MYECIIHCNGNKKDPSEAYNKCLKSCVDKQCGETMVEFMAREINALSPENGALLEQMKESELCKNAAVYLATIFPLAYDCVENQCPDSQYRKPNKKKNCITRCGNKNILFLDNLSPVEDANKKRVTWTAFKMDMDGPTYSQMPATLLQVMYNGIRVSTNSRFPYKLMQS